MTSGCLSSPCLPSSFLNRPIPPNIFWIFGRLPSHICSLHSHSLSTIQTTRRVSLPTAVWLSKKQFAHAYSCSGYKEYLMQIWILDMSPQLGGPWARVSKSASKTLCRHYKNMHVRIVSQSDAQVYVMKVFLSFGWWTVVVFD